MPIEIQTPSELGDPTFTPEEDGDSDSSVSSGYSEDSRGNVFLQFSHEQLFQDNEGQFVRPYLWENPEERTHSWLNGCVGFRVYNETTQGTNGPAGFHAGLRSQDDPPSRNDPDYMKVVVRHLQRVKEPSSIISIWTSLISGIHKLITSPNTEIAFIDLDNMSRETVPYYDGDRIQYPRIQSARSLTKQYRIFTIGFPDGSRYRYRGDPELLCWQQIHKHFIISTLTRAEFELHLQQNSDLYDIMAIDQLAKYPFVSDFLDHRRTFILRNYRVGYAIGVFLQRVGMPAGFVQYMAKEFERGFRFKNVPSENHTKGRKADRYLQGIWHGFKSDHIRAGDTTPSYLRREPLFAGTIAADDDGTNDSPSLRPARNHTGNQKKKGEYGGGSSRVKSGVRKKKFSLKNPPSDAHISGTPNEIFRQRKGPSRVPNSILFRQATQKTVNDDIIRVESSNSKISQIRRYMRHHSDVLDPHVCSDTASTGSAGYHIERSGVIAPLSSSAGNPNTDDVAMQDVSSNICTMELKSEPEVNEDSNVIKEMAQVSLDADYEFVTDTDIADWHGAYDLIEDIEIPDRQITDHADVSQQSAQHDVSLVPDGPKFPTDILTDMEYWGFEEISSRRVTREGEFSLHHRQEIKHLLGYREYHGPGT